MRPWGRLPLPTPPPGEFVPKICHDLNPGQSEVSMTPALEDSRQSTVRSLTLCHSIEMLKYLAFCL